MARKETLVDNKKISMNKKHLLLLGETSGHVANLCERKTHRKRNSTRDCLDSASVTDGRPDGKQRWARRELNALKYITKSRLPSLGWVNVTEIKIDNTSTANQVDLTVNLLLPQNYHLLKMAPSDD